MILAQNWPKTANLCDNAPLRDKPDISEIMDILTSEDIEKDIENAQLEYEFVWILWVVYMYFSCLYNKNHY